MAAPEMPWFPFWVDRWLLSRSVRLMTYEQRGIYLELLCMAWRDGSLPADIEDLAGLLGIDADRMEAAWRRIGRMFKPREDGHLINEWQEEIRAEQQAKNALQKSKSALGVEARRRKAAERNPQVNPRVDPTLTQLDEELELETDAPKGAGTPAPTRTETFVSLLPESHRTRAMAEAVRAFFAMRRENNFGTWKPTTLATNAKKYGKFTPDAVVAAFEHSTSNQYQGVFPEDFAPGGKHAPRLAVVSGGLADRNARLAAEMAEKGMTDAA